jgi:hypothetical protein
MTYSNPGTVATPTNKHNTTRPTQTQSTRSTTRNRHYIGILNGG